MHLVKSLMHRAWSIAAMAILISIGFGFWVLTSDDIGQIGAAGLLVGWWCFDLIRRRAWRIAASGFLLFWIYIAASAQVGPVSDLTLLATFAVIALLALGGVASLGRVERRVFILLRLGMVLIYALFSIPPAILLIVRASFKAEQLELALRDAAVILLNNGAPGLMSFGWSQGLVLPALIVSVPILAGLALLWSAPNQTPEIRDRRLLVLVGLLLTLMIVSLQDHVTVKHTLSQWEQVFLENYHQQNHFKKQRLSATVQPAPKTEQNETYVVILGDSLNKREMSLYGYGRETTPRLKALRGPGLAVLSSTYATDYRMQASLGPALTTATQKNGQDWRVSPSGLNIFEAAGFKTYWLSNQRFASNPLSVALDAQQWVPMQLGPNSPALYDEALLPAIGQVLDSKSGNRLLFVHLQGNRQDACDRFPPDFEKFTEGSLHRGQVGKRANVMTPKHRAAVHCYDNSILYTDHVVAEIIQLVEKQGGVSLVLFTADHAADVLYHFTEDFTFQMPEIPLVVWASEGYRNRYPERWTTLQEQRGEFFLNENLHDLLTGLAHIKTPQKDASSDLSDREYRFNQEQATLMGGSKRYEESTFFVMEKNLDALQDSGLQKRVLMHRVNSLGKLGELLNADYPSFEMDVIFDGSRKEFIIGHGGENVSSGNSLELVLQALEGRQDFRIWCDLKNFDSFPVEVLLERLEALDEKYGLKDRMILETSSVRPDVAQMVQAGFHLSYYLPSHKTHTLLKEGNPNKLRAFARRVADQTKAQGCSAISFEASLYPFVARYIKPRVADNMDLHLWDLSRWVSHDDFMEKLTEAPYFEDQRVKTILTVFYPSRFEL